MTMNQYKGLTRREKSLQWELTARRYLLKRNFPARPRRLSREGRR